MASTSLVVTAPLVIAKNEQGADVYLYKGSAVPDGQSEEWVKSHKDSGMIATPKDAEKVALEESKASVAETPPPAESAKK